MHTFWIADACTPLENTFSWPTLNLLQLKQIFQLFDDDGTERLSLEELRQAQLAFLDLLSPVPVTPTLAPTQPLRQNKQKTTQNANIAYFIMRSKYYG